MSRYQPVALGLALAGLLSLGSGFASANLIINGDFEVPDASGGDVNGAPAPPWNGFNDPNLRFTTAFIAQSGAQSTKTFGPFDFGGGVGATQLLPAVPGVAYDAGIWAQNNSTDPIQGSDFGVFKIEFLDALNQPVGGSFNLGVNLFESNQINANTPQDQWTLLDASTGPAPPGTAFMNVVFVKVQLFQGDPGGTPNGGSIFWDNASVTPVIPEPASVGLLALGAVGLTTARRRRV